MTNEQIWNGIEQLARDHGMSPSALAIAAGMDPTTLNKSKRSGTNGKPRWPSLKTIMRICNVTGILFTDFMIKYVDKK